MCFNTCKGGMISCITEMFTLRVFFESLNECLISKNVGNLFQSNDYFTVGLVYFKKQNGIQRFNIQIKIPYC